MTGYPVPATNEGLASLLNTLLSAAQYATDHGQDTSAHNAYIKVLTEAAAKRVAAAPPRPSSNPNNTPPLPPLPPVQGR